MLVAGIVSPTFPDFGAVLPLIGLAIPVTGSELPEIRGTGFEVRPGVGR
jgi:hypothetical protein